MGRGSDKKGLSEHLCGDISGYRVACTVHCSIICRKLGLVNVTVTAESVKSRRKLCVDKKGKTGNLEMAETWHEGITDAITKPILVEVSEFCKMSLGARRSPPQRGRYTKGQVE